MRLPLTTIGCCIVLIAATAPRSCAHAQQAPDPAFLQRALSALQAQRNAAMDSQVVAEARAAGLTEDLAKANARIKELETKPEKKDNE